MVIAAQATLFKNPNSSTLYLAIPADMVKDSQFPFKPNEEVDLELKPEDGTLVISSIGSVAGSLIKKWDEEEKSNKVRHNDNKTTVKKRSR